MLFFCLSLCCLFAKGQTARIRSLEQNVYQAGDLEGRLRAILALCDEYKSLQRDTLDKYAYIAYDLGRTGRDPELRMRSSLALAYDYQRWGWLDSVIVTVDPVITAGPGSDRAVYFKASRLKAMAYAGHSRFQEGLTLLYKLIDEAEACGDSLTLAENYNSIASIALARGQRKDAFTWLTRAISCDTHGTAFDPIRAAIDVNMAEAYYKLDTDSALFYIDKGIALFRSVENYSNLGLALQRKSNILIDAHKFEEAESALKEMVAIRGRLGDGQVFQDENLSLINYYIQTNQIKKAIETCKRLLRTGDIHTDGGVGTVTLANNINIRLEYYEALAKCYKLTGENDLYVDALENIIAAKDSFYRYNSVKAIAELETKYESQKSRNTIIQQQLDITRKNNRFYALLGIGFFLAAMGLVVFTGYRKRERLRTNALLEQEKHRIAADLHDNLGSYAASMISNLDWIEYGMKDPSVAIEPAVGELRNNSLAIVAQLNDTIWALKKDALSLTALSDRIKAFIQRVQNSYPGVSISVGESIAADLMLTPSHALHLFRIVQEAVNNALRHSKAHEVSVEITSEGRLWEIRIADDGMGMPASVAGGNGLNNMKDRAEKSGWTIRWEPNKPNGTIVIIKY